MAPPVGRGLRPARLVFDADGVPHASDYADRYFPRVGAGAQARHVFLAGNQLPARWAGRERFTIVETGFGLGNNFLATWDAWRRDPQRCGRLQVVSIEAHPLTAHDLARCHAASDWPELAATLHRAWPPLTTGLHPLAFDDGRVQLLLAFGDVRSMLRELDVAADAFFLDGFAPDRNPDMWTPDVLRALARSARDGATAATWSVAKAVIDGLRSAGFAVERGDGIGGKRQITCARFAPRFERRRPPRQPRPSDRHALIVGAGLAGGWAAHALARQGWRCTVLDRHPEPAAEASGNPAALFHGTVHGDDAAHARFNRCAALAAAHLLRPVFATGAAAGDVGGVLRVQAPGADAVAMRTLLATLGLPPDYVHALDAGQASALAGTALPSAAWHYPGGGWADPAALTAHLLRTPGVSWQPGMNVAALVRDGADWVVHDERTRVLARASTVVLANGADALRLWPHGAWPLARARGQVSWWPAAPQGAPQPKLPLSGLGYAVRLAGGGLLCGATTALGDDDDRVRDADHAFNLGRLAALTGWQAPAAATPLGRVGWRVQTPDRLPLVGPVASPLQRRTTLRLRDVEREDGLFVLTALASRGLTWGPLAGQILAAWITGAPMPIEGRLRDAVDPARWQVRAHRRA